MRITGEKGPDGQRGRRQEAGGRGEGETIQQERNHRKGHLLGLGLANGQKLASARLLILFLLLLRRQNAVHLQICCKREGEGDCV